MVYYSTYLIAELGLGLVVISTTPSFGILNDSTRLLKKIKIDKVRLENNIEHLESILLLSYLRYQIQKV